MRGWTWITLALAVPLASIALAMPAPSADRAGYLAPGSFDILPILEPAPVKGDARYDADRRIFRATRRLLDTPRGALAVNDVQRAPDAMLADFACALGASLTPNQLPRTVAVIERASVDTNAQKDRAKDFYKRTRPLFIDRGPACQPRAKLAKTFDYPSGHTTGGWTWALILADLAPERATAILARGRAFGQSRAICGAHNASAVEAGFYDRRRDDDGSTDRARLSRRSGSRARGIDGRASRCAATRCEAVPDGGEPGGDARLLRRAPRIVVPAGDISLSPSSPGVGIGAVRKEQP